MLLPGTLSLKLFGSLILTASRSTDLPIASNTDTTPEYPFGIHLFFLSVAIGHNGLPRTPVGSLAH